jgi:hypothetical protein
MKSRQMTFLFIDVGSTLSCTRADAAGVRASGRDTVEHDPGARCSGSLAGGPSEHAGRRPWMAF